MDNIFNTYPDETQKNTWDRLKKRITVLNERAWEDKISWDQVDRWLQNFSGEVEPDIEKERLHALYLLSQFMYFGSKEIRVLLKSIFQDLFISPLIQEIRDGNGGIRNEDAIIDLLNIELENTRFLGVGNPSESGAHLLYYFRQENGLSKDHFIDPLQIFVHDDAGAKLRYSNVSRYVFIDDICGSGETAVRYSENVLKIIQEINPRIKVYYFSLFSTSVGMERVRSHSVFGENSAAVFEMDGSYKCLSVDSRNLNVVPDGIEPNLARAIALHYGKKICPLHEGGYMDSQMLLGLHHNTPDNTLPIIWCDDANGAVSPWIAIFKRYPKV